MLLDTELRKEKHMVGTHVSFIASGFEHLG